MMQYGSIQHKHFIKKSFYLKVLQREVVGSQEQIFINID